MARYFYKIPSLVLHESPAFPPVIEDAWASVSLVEEEYVQVPGVPIKSGEIVLDEDTIVNYEFWVVTDITAVDIEAVLQGSDGLLAWVDASKDPGAAMAREFLAATAATTGHLPTMIVNVDPSSSITCHDRSFLEGTWDTRIVECTSLNRSCMSRFGQVVDTLVRGITFHPDAGPVDLDTGWLREGFTWQAMHRRIEQEHVDAADKTFLGRAFMVMSLLRARHSSLEAYLHGSLASRWLEMAGQHVLAYTIAERLGDKGRTTFLKRKHLQAMLDEATGEFNYGRFNEAARKYEEAAYWNKLELVEPEKIDELFLKAVDACISCFEFDRLPDLLAQVKSPATTLSRLKGKMFRGIDYLEQQGLLERANFQVDALAKIHLKHDLRETANELGRRHAAIKLALLKEKLKTKFLGEALLLIEEIAVVKDAFSLDVMVPDELLAIACTYLIQDAMFQEAGRILAMVHDPLKQKELLARQTVREEEIRQEEKQRREQQGKDARQRLLPYKIEERDDALRHAKARRKILFELVEQGKPDRAMHFVKINARWLKDLDQEQIAADLVVQACKHAIKHDYTPDLAGIQDMIHDKAMKDIVDAMVQRAREITTQGDVAAGSGIIEQFQHALRSVHHYQEGDNITPLLAGALLDEASKASADAAGSIEVIIEKHDKILKLAGTSGALVIDHDKMDDILERIFDHHARAGRIHEAEGYLNKITSIETRKRLQRSIDDRLEQREAQQADQYRRREAVRIVRERLQETRRILMLRQESLPDQRRQREQAIDEARRDGVLPAGLPCLVTTPDELGTGATTMAPAQARLVASFVDKDDIPGVATGTLVAVMLAVKRDDIDAARAALGVTSLVPSYRKHDLVDHPAYSIASDLVEAIATGSGDVIQDALETCELLPLVRGERFMPFLILGQPVPEQVRARGDHALADPRRAFRDKIRDVFPYLVDAICAELEPVHESLVVRRDLLGRQGKLAGRDLIAKGILDKAAMHYQSEAYTFFDEGEDAFGWTSMVMAVLLVVKQGTSPTHATTLFKNMLASMQRKDDLASHPVASLLALYLRIVEHGLVDELATAWQAIDTLPLLDAERDVARACLQQPVLKDRE